MQTSNTTNSTKTLNKVNHINLFLEKFDKRKDYFFGYPSNFENSFSNCGEMYSYLFNNIGDPYEERKMSTNTKPFEREIISFYSDLFNLEKGNEWGYITNGSSESILQALFMAREMYNNTKLYFSSEAHYCVKKNAYLLNINSQEISVDENTKMDINILEKEILANNDSIPVILLNIGNTFSGAVDDCVAVCNMLKRNNIKDFYIHLDAALAGQLIPFVEEYKNINFDLPINSLSISGHKFLGLPNPSGVFLTKKSVKESISTGYVSYIDSHDLTISGSRSGSNVLMWWKVLNDTPIGKMQENVDRCIENTEYLLEGLKTIKYPIYQVHLNTIVIDAPHNDLMLKWHMPFYNGLTHIVVMPHITKAFIDEFIRDLDLHIDNICHN